MTRLRAWLLPVIVVLIMLWAMTGFVTAQPAPCFPRDVLAGYLRDKGLPLHAWGLTGDGNMAELFLGGGDWVVVETTPAGCSRVTSALDKAGGRLWKPERNPALPPTRLGKGQEM